jgi:hypothetical protein
VTLNPGNGVSLNHGEAFNDRCRRDYKQTRGRPWGAVVIVGNTILVQELEPGCEYALKRYLNKLVKAIDLTQGTYGGSVTTFDGRWQEQLATPPTMLNHEMDRIF